MAAPSRGCAAAIAYCCAATAIIMHKIILPSTAIFYRELGGLKVQAKTRLYTFLTNADNQFNGCCWKFSFRETGPGYAERSKREVLGRSAFRGPRRGKPARY